MTSSAFMIASFSAWLLERLLSSLNLSCSVSTLPLNTVTPIPLLVRSCFRPWKYATIAPRRRLLCCWHWLYPQGEASSLGSFFASLVFLPVVMFYSVATSSALMIMGVRPVRMQSASWDMVRYALALLKLISLCTLIYFALLHSFLMASIHPGAVCSSCGSIAPL